MQIDSAHHYIVNISRQGLLTIPAKLCTQLGFRKKGKAKIYEKDGKLIIKPAKDLLEFY